MNDISSEILERAARGDIGAFEQVYKALSGFVYNVAVRITRNDADAQEATQDVFMKIYRKLKDFQFRSSFKTWVYRITVNTAINQYRKALRETKNRVDHEGVIENIPAPYAPTDNLMKSDSDARLNSLLDTLGPEQKACMVLREIEGLSYREIAVALDIPVNTVRTRLKRGREALLASAQRRVAEDVV